MAVQHGRTQRLAVTPNLFPSILLAMLLCAHVANAQNNIDKTIEEEVLITGIKQSLKNAADIKRNATQIVDAISAEDIGKLPDTNIADALSRVTGLTIGRDDAGDGSSFQIRGFSSNALTINGKSVVTDGFNRRENSLNALSSGLVKNITVKKSPTADNIEGGTGGSVELTLFSPLDFKRGKRRLNVQINDNSVKSDPSTKITGLLSDRWDFGTLGQFGALINLEKNQRNQYSEGVESKYGGLNARSSALLTNTGEIAAGDHPRFIPRTTDLNIRDFDIETTSVSGNLQWAPTDRFNIQFGGQITEYSKDASYSNLNLNTTALQGRRRSPQQGVTLEPGATWYSLLRTARPEEYDASTLSNPYIGNEGPSTGLFLNAAPATGNVERSLLTSGIFLADSSLNNRISTVNSNSRLFLEERTQKNLSLDAQWQIIDSLTMDIAYAESDSETDRLKNEIKLRLQGTHPDTNAPLYPSLAYDIRDNSDIPDYEILWREPLVNNGAHVGGQTIANYSPNLFDPSVRNELFKVNKLFKQLNRTRAFQDEFRMDIDWDVNFSGLTRIELGARTESLENFKNRGDFRTPFIPGFLDNDGDGIPDDEDGDGLPDDVERRDATPNVTIASLVTTPLIPGQAPLSEELVDAFFDIKEGFDGVSGDFPRRYWGATADPKKWNQFIHAVYGGYTLGINELQTERIVEDSTAFYLKLNFEYMLGPMPLSGNIGVRYVETDGFSEAFIHHCSVPWARDEVRSAVVRAEWEAWQQARLNDPNAATPTYSFNDSALSLVPLPPLRNSQDPRKVPRRCSTTDGPGFPKYPVIFQDNPWRLAGGVPATAVLRTGTAGFDGEPLQKDYLTSFYEYSERLPSLNLSLGLTKNKILRGSVYKTMARPGPNDLSLDPTIANGIQRQGNPALKPYITESFDISLEWYINKIDSISVTYFHKDLIDQKLISTEYNLQLDALVRQPINGGDGKVDGIELAGVHSFTYLPGLFSGLGIQANYTYIDSALANGYDEITGRDLPTNNQSASSYNLQLFYDMAGWNFRFAYNWRDIALIGEENGYRDNTLAAVNPDVSQVAGQTVYNNYIEVNPRTWNDASGRLDFSASYDMTKNLNIIVKVSNLTKESSRRYAWIKNAERKFDLAASIYRLGVIWKIK